VSPISGNPLQFDHDYYVDVEIDCTLSYDKDASIEWDVVGGGGSNEGFATVNVAAEETCDISFYVMIYCSVAATILEVNEQSQGVVVCGEAVQNQIRQEV